MQLAFLTYRVLNSCIKPTEPQHSCISFMWSILIQN